MCSSLVRRVCSVGELHIAAASPIGVVRLASTAALDIRARSDLRSAAVAIGSVETDEGWRIAVGGDDPRPQFFAVDLAV